VQSIEDILDQFSLEHTMIGNHRMKK